MKYELSSGTFPLAGGSGLAIVIGMTGALGKMNLISLSSGFRCQNWTACAQPLPVSPRPCAKMTVAVCLVTAWKTRGDVDILAG